METPGFIETPQGDDAPSDALSSFYEEVEQEQNKIKNKREQVLKIQQEKELKNKLNRERHIKCVAENIIKTLPCVLARARNNRIGSDGWFLITFFCSTGSKYYKTNFASSFTNEECDLIFSILESSTKFKFRKNKSYKKYTISMKDDQFIPKNKICCMIT